MIKYCFFSIFSLLFIFNSAFAQPPAGAFGGGNKMSIISGTLVESSGNQALEFAAVSILKAGNDSLITGILTEEQGRFQFEIPLRYRSVKVEFAYLGFKTLVKTIELKEGENVNMGQISLDPDQQLLDEVVVTAEQSNVNLFVDRKVYNVDKDLSTKGGTGEDVMKNIPGVNVDADGGVNVRNSNAQVFVDGRPTTLELDKIPADQIEFVEVITNPSVKFDASSSGGIINIRLKQNLKPGYNGTLTAGIGTSDRYTTTVNLNMKREPFNLALNYNYNQAGNDIFTYSNRNTIQGPGAGERFIQESNAYNYRGNHSFRTVFDYKLSQRDFLSLSGNVSLGSWRGNQKQTFNSSINNSVRSTGEQNQIEDNEFNHYTAQIYYNHKMKQPGREFTSDLQYNGNRSNGINDLSTNNYNENGVLLPGMPILQNIDNTNKSNSLTYQLDYINPLQNGARFEAGVRVFYKRSEFQNLINKFDREENIFVNDSVLSNQFDIIENVNAAYVNYVGKWGWLNYQFGLRFEHSFYEGNVLNTENSFTYQYPNSPDNIVKAVFPGLYLSRKFGENQELQFNVSRKIGRPGFWQLTPRVNINDPRNLRLGNPNLLPEFINLSEINYSLTAGQFNLLSSVYGRVTEDPISWITFPFDGDSSVLVTQAVNGTYDYTGGWENTMKWRPNEKLEMTLSVELSYVRANASTPQGNFSNSGFMAQFRPMISYKLPWNMSAQINGNYRTANIMAQGRSLPVYFMDVTLNKKIGKAWNINLTLSDAFDSRLWGQYFETPSYTQESTRRREARFVRLTVSYSFGATDPGWMKKKTNGQDRGGMEDGEF